MVLDDASPQADTFDNSQNNGTNNNNNSSRNNPSLGQYRIGSEHIIKPDPLTLYFGFFGQRNWKNRLTNRLNNQVDKTHVLIQRTPSQREMEAFATISSRSVYHSRIGYPLGVAAGMANLHVSLRKSGAIPPGIRQSPRELYHAVAAFWKTEPAAARLAFALASFKAFMWIVGTSTVTAVWATYEEAKDTMFDPRLASFVAELRRQNPDEVRRRRMAAAQESFRRARMGEAPQQSNGVYADTSGDSYSGGGDDGYAAVSSDEFADSSGSDNSQPAPSRTYSTSTSTSTSQPASSQSARQDTGLDFFDEGDDDASPTAPEYRKGGSAWSRLNPSASQGSAWERIRQQNAPQGSPQDFSRNAGQSSDRSSVDYTSYVDEKQREREQAQADFERMLDAERNGSAASGGERGWRRGGLD